VFLKHFRFVTPFGIFTQPVTAFLRFWNIYDNIKNMITTNAFPEECNKLPQHYHLKNAFHNISFQTAIGFHKYFQCHGLLCNRVAIFIIRG